MKIHDNPIIVWLDQNESQNISHLGAKTANLSRLAEKYAVPRGFCLTTVAFEQWITMGKPQALPFPIQKQLIQAYQQLAQTTDTLASHVAVRSSAVDEDSQTASFAGQYETYLNVVDVNGLIDAVLACWHSAFTERVQTYRQQAHLSKAIQLAVLVQEMVSADISIVAFSTNPINGNQAEVVINATWGLGQSLVSGTVTPDSYFVNKRHFTLLKSEIATKEQMTVMSSQGIQEVVVPRPMNQLPVLNEAQITEISQLAVDLEHEMGWTVDIECAYQKNQLYLLQCRPITIR